MTCTRPPLAVVMGSLLANLAVGVADFFLVADGKAAGGYLLGVGLVNVRHGLLKGGRVKAVREGFSPADNVRSGYTFGQVIGKHIRLDFIFQRFDLLGGFVLDGLPFFQSLDGDGQFVDTHCKHSFDFDCRACPPAVTI